MAAMALPIRELSASVTVDAARTQVQCLDIAESSLRSGIVVSIKELWAAWRVDVCFDKLMGSQRNLVGHLQGLDTENFLAEDFIKLYTDLNNLTATTYSVVDSANEIPKYADEWRPKLDAIAEMAAHVDNFAESYRVAADSTCTSLLATIADNIMAQAAVPAH